MLEKTGKNSPISKIGTAKQRKKNIYDSLGIETGSSVSVVCPSATIAALPLWQLWYIGICVWHNFKRFYSHPSAEKDSCSEFRKHEFIAISIAGPWGCITDRWRYLSRMLECCVFNKSKTNLLDENDALFIRDKYSHLAVSLHVIQPHWSSIFEILTTLVKSQFLSEDSITFACDWKITYRGFLRSKAGEKLALLSHKLVNSGSLPQPLPQQQQQRQQQQHKSYLAVNTFLEFCWNFSSPKLIMKRS